MLLVVGYWLLVVCVFNKQLTTSLEEFSSLDSVL